MQCKDCKKKPDEIDEYITYGKAMKLSPEEFVRREEGTYNPETKLFYCTDCYVKRGMPLGTA